MCEMRNDAQGRIKEAMLSPQRHLKLIGDQYPGAWKLYDAFMADRGKKLIDWPDWCYCPVSAAHAIVNPKSLADIQNVPILACLAAWRMTQGIYRFDPDIRLQHGRLVSQLCFRPLYRSGFLHNGTNSEAHVFYSDEATGADDGVCESSDRKAFDAR